MADTDTIDMATGVPIGMLASLFGSPGGTESVPLSPALMATNGNAAASGVTGALAAPQTPGTEILPQAAPAPTLGMLSQPTAAPPVSALGPNGLPIGMGLLNGGAPPPPAPMPAAMASAQPGPPLQIAPPIGPQAPGPAQALPAAPQSAPGQPNVPDTSLLGRIQNWLGNHQSTLMALGAGMAGAQSIGQGLNRGGTLAGPAMQQDIAQQKLNATVQALRARGMPQDAAVAAASNPALLQQILPQMFGAKQRQFTQIGEDFLGNKKFGFVDPVAGKVYNLDGSPFDAQQGASSTIPLGQDGQPLQGQALLSYLERTDPATAAGIKGMLAGNIGAQGRNLQKLAPLASLVDPSFSMATFPQRAALLKSYQGGGKDFQETQALNTVGGHLSRLMESADGLGNTRFPWINTIGNYLKENTTGSPALVKFRNDLVTTQNELAKAYHGGHVSDAAYSAFNKSINEAQTPAEMRTAIGELASLLQSKIEAKESGYRAGMTNSPLPADYRAINDEARQSFNRIGTWARTGVMPPRQGEAPAQPAQAATPTRAELQAEASRRAQAQQPAAAPAMPAATAAPALPRIASPADAAKLAPGTHFLDANGVERIRP